MYSIHGDPSSNFYNSLMKDLSSPMMGQKVIFKEEDSKYLK